MRGGGCAPSRWARGSATTPTEIQQRRRGIEARLAELGADTVCCQHQTCHLIWAHYASPRVAVVHAVSVLAEALGCAHPDRYQAAALLGDPRRVVDETRPIWESWGLSQERALELAEELSDPAYAQGVTQCSCEGGTCGERLIGADELSARLGLATA